MKKDIETVDYLTSTFGISLHVVSGTYGGDRTLYEILKEKKHPVESDLYYLQQKILNCHNIK